LIGICIHPYYHNKNHKNPKHTDNTVGTVQNPARDPFEGASSVYDDPSIQLFHEFILNKGLSVDQGDTLMDLYTKVKLIVHDGSIACAGMQLFSCIDTSADGRNQDEDRANCEEFEHGTVVVRSRHRNLGKMDARATHRRKAGQRQI
jgi:hypothetical protein